MWLELGLWCLKSLSTIYQISWLLVLVVEETGVPRENHPPAPSHELSHNVVSSAPSHKWDSNSLL